MAKNFLQEGKTLEFVAPAGGVVAGRGYMIGDTFVVALVDAAAGTLFNGRTDGVFALQKAAAITPAPGARLFVIAATGVITNVASGNIHIGTHASPVVASANDATIPVRLGIVA